jgi:hypothetical protein
MTEGLFAAPEDAVLDELWRVAGWPKDPAKDEAFVRELRRQFPQVDLVEESRRWALWMLDKAPKGKVRHRDRFRNWCKGAVAYRGAGGGDRRAPVTRAPGGDAPRWAKPVADPRDYAAGWG